MKKIDLKNGEKKRSDFFFGGGLEKKIEKKRVEKKMDCFSYASLIIYH